MCNYRIGTRINKSWGTKFDLVKTREFSIIKCYYNDNYTPISYNVVGKGYETGILDGFNNIEDLKGTYNLI